MLFGFYLPAVLISLAYKHSEIPTLAHSSSVSIAILPLGPVAIRVVLFSSTLSE